MFFLEAFQIPTSSMENTLLTGDFIIVNKIAYKLSTPTKIPFTDIKIPHLTLLETWEPEINELVVFNYPDILLQDSAIVSNQFIKRIVAGPGDTLQFINKKIFVNNEELALPSTIKYSNEKVRRRGVVEDNIFPNGSKWNRDNYGPIIVPKTGDTIVVNSRNLERVKQIIVMDYGERVLREEGSVITLNARPIQEYVIQNDHYFVIGDNLDVSMDSRYFGFINEEMIIGKTLFIYWSMDNNKSAPGPLGFLSGLRTKRLFKAVD
ncbi:MAG: signal peptidase I [Ignavibacteriaceae bacterium]|nr:signal peptidase I [Ignavibacteriaceae bacterium]